MNNRVTQRIFAKTAKVIAVLCLLVTLGCSQMAVRTQGPETKQQRDKRMAWWREARFGLFIHWGIYSVPAGEWDGETGYGEWIMRNAKIPIARYEQFAGQFNPVKFNAKEWVDIAKKAGMKYIVITSKHHDGFSMYDTKVINYDIVDSTPFKRDVLRELADECRKQDIKIGWYYSVRDWHHPDYVPRLELDKRSSVPNYDRYIDFMKAQVRELLTNYGPIGVMWFDGAVEQSAKKHRPKEVVSMIRRLQPDIIINNRIGIPQDFDTPEQTIPDTGIPGRDWETCMTMNRFLGYNKYGTGWKSTEELIQMLVDIASKGGNFLLNVGPDAEGVIPAASVERLAAMGEWMKVNGESIYGSGASPLGKFDWGRCTSKRDKLYLHVFDWPADGRLEVTGLKCRVKKAYLLADGKRARLAVKRESEDKVVITLPDEAIDKIDTVIVLKIKEQEI